MKKTVRKIHLWLGLSSGLVVVLLGITGCILAFETEIRNVTESYRFVTAQPGKSFLPPSQLRQIAEKHLVSHKALGIEYPSADKAAQAAFYDEDHYEIVFMNPYTGEFLKHKNMNRDFFRVVLDGHFYLWLPEKIGQPIAASATLIFLIMMITGLILWWPKKKSMRKQRFTIKWNVKWRRKNYDLHNVLGFYMSWVAIFIAITGLVFGFQWFAKSVYFISSGGVAMEENAHPISDTLYPRSQKNLGDFLWQKHLPSIKPHESLAVYFASLPTDPIEVVVNHRQGTYYNSDFYHYDQYSGKHLAAKGSYDGKFAEAKLADKIVRMNYDIHVGAVLGFAGKLMAFFASLIAASLPITGFIIWWGRRNKSPKKMPASSKIPVQVA